MKFHWFIRRGIFYLPASIVGWFIFGAMVVYTVYLFIDIDSRSHSVSDTLINWVFDILIVGVAYSIVGFFTAKPGQ
jgi:hypothetical protein